MHDTPRPPLSQLIIYAIGQLGWSLASFGAANLMVYFYMPPEEGKEVIFPEFIYQGQVLGILTVIGLIAFGGRLFDAITDPMIAQWSDKTESNFGKRKKLMAIAALPFAVFSFLVFFPFSFEPTTLNTIALLIFSFLLFLSMTIYVVPYTALISELGHHAEDRMKISTMIAVTWILGFIIGNTAYLFQGQLEDAGYHSVGAFQMVIGGFALFSFLCMMVPVLFLNENKYSHQQPVSINLSTAIKSVFNNKNFRYFAASDLMYWLSLTFIQLGASYYITVLMGMEKEKATVFLTIALFGSLALYVPVNYITKKTNKKFVLSVAFIIFSALFGSVALIGNIPVSTNILFYVLALIAAIPMACFSIIPNAIVADIVHHHEEETGLNQSGMFFAVRAFMMKMGISLANLIFPSLLLLGRTADNDWGVRMTGICAVVFCIVGYVLFQFFRERE